MDELTVLRREQQRIAERIETLQGQVPNNDEMSKIAAFSDKTDDVFRALGQVGARGPLPGEGSDYSAFVAYHWLRNCCSAH
jgi:hypothetical protein